MKNNRQIGLDGRIFVSTAIRRGAFFVFMLMLYGIVTAFADVLKLTGESGVAMGAFTTTLLIYDFVVSLMLVVVVFYAYFLECGADVPVIKEKPLMLFGYFRLGYYVLLAYYICYRMLYCFANTETVSVYIGIFYAVYLALIGLLIMANCYIFNTIARNIIRRSYEKSFHHLAIAGFIVQALLPVAYILARVNMGDIGDEYFTSSFSDLLRLLVAPILMTSLWFLFLHAVGQVHDVYSEVDTALRGKNYQITYTALPDGSHRASRRKNQPEAPASAVLLPAGYTAPAAAAAPKALLSPAAPAAPAKAAPSAPTKKSKSKHAAPAVRSESQPEVIADAVAEVAEQETAAETEALTAEAAIEAAEKAAETDAPEAVKEATEAVETPAEEDADTEFGDEIITVFAEEARKAVAITAAQQEARKAQHASKVTPRQNGGKKQNASSKNTAAQPQPALPVQEFDPYPAASIPHKPQHTQQRGGNPARGSSQSTGQNAHPTGSLKNRPAGAAQNGGRPGQNGAARQPQNGRPVQNGRPGSNQPQQGRPQGHPQAGQPAARQKQPNPNGRQR